jgi:hypothetical protein
MSDGNLARLAHVTWIGGSPCAGKSTVADALAAHGMTVYRCDDAFYEHMKVVVLEHHPVFHRLAHASCDEIWMRPVARQVAEEIALYREEFPLILADLLALPADRPIVAEGAALLPELIAGLGIDRERAIWMVPTEAFQRKHYGRRAWRHDVLRACSAPEVAWENWMRRDAGFAREIAAQVEYRGFRLITVDGHRSLAEMERDVARALGL